MESKMYLELTENQMKALVMVLLERVDGLLQTKERLANYNRTLCDLLSKERAKTGTEPSLAEALATYI
ncbi:MAG: hypothetical protein SOV75_02370 [Candidatus Limiplasma sp.]|nr:hypothetical protein [Candidatus Limiplasma sp.]